MAGTADVPRDEHLQKFLQEARLKEYEEGFINQGYDMIEDFVDMDVNSIENVARDVGISQPGHTQRLKRAVISLQSRTKNPPADDGEHAGTSQNDSKFRKSASPKLPENIKTLLIPNPLTAKLQFYNELLVELYQDCYSDLSGIAFKEYYNQQRHVRWEIKSSLQKLSSEVDAVFNSKNGQSLNVHRYSSVPVEARPSDVQRATNTRKFVQGKEVKLTQTLEELQDKRSVLFGKQMTVASHRTLELTAYDNAIQEIRSLIQRILKVVNDVTHVLQQLKSRFFAGSIAEADSRRISRNKKEQRKKKRKRNENRLLAGANRLGNFLCGQDVLKHFGVRTDKEIHSEHLKILDHKILKAKTDLKPLEYMMKMGCFDEDCQETVSSIISTLKIPKKAKGKRVKIDHNKSQKTLTSMWASSSSKPAQDDDKPVEDDDTPDEDDDTPDEDDDTPAEDDDKPAEDDEIPAGDDDDKPAEDDDTPAGDDDTPAGDDDDKAAEDDDKPAEDDDKAAKDDDKPAKANDRPAEDDDKAAEDDDKPAEDDDKPAEDDIIDILSTTDMDTSED